MNDHSAILIELALAEDLGEGDLTSHYFTPANRLALAFIAVRKRVCFPALIWRRAYSHR